MHAFDLTFGQKDAALQWTRILAAGFASVAFFRSSIFTARVGDQDFAVGPVSFLQMILAAVDRAVDSRRASGRADEVALLVKGISYEKAFIALPAYCLALMQNMPADDQKRLGERSSRCER